MTADRTDLLVALAIKNKQHPYRNSFPSFIIKAVATVLQSTPRVAQQEIEKLNIEWRTDKWRTIIRTMNIPIEPEEIAEWEQSYKHASCTL